MAPGKEQPLYLLESTQKWISARDESVLLCFEVDEVISSPTRLCATLEVIGRSQECTAHGGVFFPEEKHCHFSIPFASLNIFFIPKQFPSGRAPSL